MTTVFNEDVDTILYVRAYLYELAHVVFGGEPNESLVAALASEETADALLVASDRHGDAYDLLRSACIDLRGDARMTAPEIDKLQSEYMRLVGGPEPKAAYPWESMYVANRKLLFQKSTLIVRDAYSEFGYRLKLLGRVPDDHLSLECAFMAELSRLTIVASDNRATCYRLLDGQRRFLEEHLLRWVPFFAADLSEAEPGCLYALFANMLAALIGDDRVAVAALIGSVLPDPFTRE